MVSQELGEKLTEDKDQGDWPEILVATASADLGSKAIRDSLIA
jgi:hypothetical protein